jgi:hypothetical protein
MSVETRQFIMYLYDEIQYFEAVGDDELAEFFWDLVLKLQRGKI